MRKGILPVLFASISLSMLVSCEKAEETSKIKSNEKTLVLLPEAENGAKNIALDLVASNITVDLIEIRRNTPNESSLNSTQVVKVALSNTAITELIGDGVVELPRNVYTSHADNPFDGQYWTVTFNPGEFTKTLKIVLNPTALLTLGRVGLGFALAEAPGAEISGAKSKMAVELGAKNAWDGVYRIRYRLVHPTVTIGGNGTVAEWDFPSSGPRSIDWDFATVFTNFSTGGLTYFGDASGPSLQVRMTINTDNTVTLSNIGPRAVPLGFPALQPIAGANNRYDPATKTIYAAYQWAGTPTRQKFDTLTYLRPR